jgi:hypothetical protein
MLKRGETRTPEFREVAKEMRGTPSRMVNDPDDIRIKYLRYADDWVVGKGGSEDRKISFFLNRDWTKKRDAFQSGKLVDIDVVRTWVKMRTRSKLGMPCCLCGEAVGQIVMHHVRHVRKLSHKREATGFNRILRAINRKQIPVCTVCHGKIHRGEYDNFKLSELEYIPR